MNRLKDWSIGLIIQKLRRKLIQTGLNVYRGWLKKNRIGRWIGQQILKWEFISQAEIMGSTWLQFDRSLYISKEIARIGIDNDQDIPGFHLSPPLNIKISAEHTVRPHINVLLPSLRRKHMSGGPNTALLLAAHLVDLGESVRIVAVDASAEGEEEALYLHMDGLFGRPVNRERIKMIDGFERSKPITIGAYDIFLATAWWTAQIAKYAIRQTNYDKFIYLIQDFEPILHEGSTFQARALETYGLPHIPVINTRLLLDHLVKEGSGLYAQPAFASDALFFEPAIDRNHYFPETKTLSLENPSKRVLLFYARPTIARRNLFEVGVAALRKAVASGTLDKNAWEIWGMGEKFDAISLSNGAYLNPLPWMSFEQYAKRVRTSDLLLSLMLSPHPSYPPLEMAASGKLVVTNSYSVKTPTRMQALSPNILVANPDPDSIAALLESAAGRINAGLPSPDPRGTINLPSSWDESLGKIVPRLKERVDELRDLSIHNINLASQRLSSDSMSEYERFRTHRLLIRREDGPYFQEPGLLSFITSAYNTDPTYLEELASSILLQDGGTNFEWLILNNGSTNKNTIETLMSIAKHSCVRLVTVEKNIGIIGGMRYLLERASGRYVIPLDSDDVIEPDCAHVLTRFLHENNFPALVYTDEDKLADGRYGSPYLKPDWDPVLFANSCYIAHMCVIEREKALQLNLYTDFDAEGSHDWDSFIKFMQAGYEPLHLSEVLYSWRMHSQSTSGNITSKDYITSSHQAVLDRFLKDRNTPHIELVPSPFFHFNVDWWFRRKRENSSSYISVIIGAGSTKQISGVPEHDIFSIDPKGDIVQFAKILDQTKSELIHLCWSGITPDSDEWFWDAQGMIELFPDTVVVGGTLHNERCVRDGPRFFGFGSGCECPDRGRELSDSGYFGGLWKSRSVSAVSSGHCVIKTEFLKDVISELIEEQAPLVFLGPWLGALAREKGKRVVFSPFMGAFTNTAPEDSVSSKNLAHFLSRFWQIMPDGQLISPKLGLEASSAYTPVSEIERKNHLVSLQKRALTYSEWFNFEIMHRVHRYPLPKKVPSLSIITSVYERSHFAFLELLAESVCKQSLGTAQWVIVAHGPIQEDTLRTIREKASTIWGATLIIETQPLGISGAMRVALEHAHGQYILPVDADDLLTKDALQIMAHEIVRRNYPDLIYSDEDLLVENKFTNPYLRSTFDPILNLDNSYVWHLCAIKRETAINLHLYEDPETTWCLDWDNITRIANVGGRIEHVPEILYHWRHHPDSTTNKPEGDPKSLDSVRYLLEKQIVNRGLNSEKFSVEVWPENRGAKELYISRRNIDLPKFVWEDELDSYLEIDNPGSTNAILIVTMGYVIIDDDKVFTEVVRLFELHQKVAAIGGRVVDMNGKVIDGCLVANQVGELESPWIMRDANDLGPYALLGKPHKVLGTGLSMAFFRINALKAANIQPPVESSAWASWIASTCNQLLLSGWETAYSPLVIGKSTYALSTSNSKRSLPHSLTNKSANMLTRYGPSSPYNPI